MKCELTQNEILDANFFNATTLWSAPFGKLIFDNVPMNGVHKMLDIGCATGFPLIQLADRFGSDTQCFGIDPWKAAVYYLNDKIEHQKISNIQTVIASAEKLPFQNESFDLIVSNLGINNFDNPSRVILESYRALSLTGTLAVSTNCKGHMKEFYELFRNTSIELKLENLISKIQLDEDRRLTKDQITNMFEECGFKLSKTISDEFHIRYANGKSFLESYFIRTCFLQGWKNIVGDENWLEFEETIISKIDKIVQEKREFRLTIPMLYLEFLK